MSERYGKCPHCDGTGAIRDAVLLNTATCPRCDGTGFDGSFTAWSEQQKKIEDIKADQEMERIG